ncbi:MAG: hypothetical protein A3G34_04440 [Candidatus Lindowbacteria bacterium RIFCSPLOWO2_12_FULL_62_27]|nr:MAG: hypothetical protein A3G34_04440 [Candidatus Lindowbacteria bacterium RIFCSPLOWO2_12_FULL_62_27]
MTQAERYFGKYKLIEPLELGGMGETYLAEDVVQGARLVVKIMPAPLSKNAAFRDRFMRECKVLRKMDHPGIPRHLEEGEIDGRRYLAMEFIRGQSLARIMGQAPARINEKLTETVLRGVARILAYAHSLGILHRDVSPQNILITEGGEVKLIDFGISKLADEITLSMTGEYLGTPAYMAPEQIMAFGTKAPDARSDVWSLGAVGFRLLTGRRLYDEDSPVEVVRRITDLVVPAPSVLDVKPDASPRLARIVDRALQKIPKYRYESAEAIARELERSDRATPDFFSPARRYWLDQMVYLPFAKRWAVVDEEGRFGNRFYFGLVRQDGSRSRRVSGSAAPSAGVSDAGRSSGCFADDVRSRADSEGGHGSKACTECGGGLHPDEFCPACGLIAAGAASSCTVVARHADITPPGPSRPGRIKKWAFGAAGVVAAALGVFLWMKLTPDRPAAVGQPKAVQPAEAPGGEVPVDPSKININAASLAELAQIKGIGLQTASQIVILREIAGPFKHINEVGMIPGVTEETMEELKPLAYAGPAAEKLPSRPKVNINTASPEELKKTLPRMKNKIVRQEPWAALNHLIEYRQENGPFKNMEEIREVPGYGRSGVGKNYWLVSKLCTVQ